VNHLSAVLALLSLANVSTAHAHDSGYVCQATCAYGQGSAQLTSQDSNEQIAFDALLQECKGLRGNLVGTSPSTPPNATEFCHVVWH
jgi:hypothetical protein